MEKEKEDRISSLPDCLLLEIISCLKLSTKEVIKTTSTISKRWQHLWTQLPTLLFIDKDDDVTEPNYYTDRDNYFSFINKTLTQCPTNLNLNKFELRIKKNRLHQPTPWIRHAITRNVQEVDLRIGKWRYGNPFILDDELFFNNSCLMSMKLSNCAFNPPNAAIRWDKLKFLCIEDVVLEGDLIGKILSGSPCLETLELDCYVKWRFSISLFGNFRVERLTCDTEAYKWFTNGDDTGSFDLGNMTMKLSRCVSNPPNGWDNLIFLRINFGKLDDDLIGKILSGSPCLETLELNYCYGVRRINIASKSVKNLVLSNYDNYSNVMGNYIDTVEINAPYILSLTIEETLSLVKILLLNVSFLVKADLRFRLSCGFASELGRDQGDIEDGLLQGLLSSLGHVNEVTFGDDCLQVLSRLKKRGFQFPKSSDVTLRGRYFLQPQIFVLIIILFFVFCVTMVSNLLAH